MRRASGTFQRRRLSGVASCAAALLLGGCAHALAAPTLLAAVGAMLRCCLLMSIELRLLLGRQDGANLRLLLGTEGLAALHYLLGLFHVAAEAHGVALLAGSARCFHERLGAITQRLILRLVLLTDRFDLGLLGVGQVEIATKATTFACAAGALPELTVGTRTAAMVAAIRGALRSY